MSRIPEIPPWPPSASAVIAASLLFPATQRLS